MTIDDRKHVLIRMLINSYQLPFRERLKDRDEETEEGGEADLDTQTPLHILGHTHTLTLTGKVEGSEGRPVLHTRCPVDVILHSASPQFVSDSPFENTCVCVRVRKRERERERVSEF